jgi:hypothetical protein
MKRFVLCGVMGLVAMSAALSALAQAPPSGRPGSAGGRPGGSAPGGPGRPGGGGSRPTPQPMPGKPGGGGSIKPPPGKPGGSPRPPPGKPGGRPPSSGHPAPRPPPGHRPPPPGHRPPPPRRPPNRPIYGWNGHRYRTSPFRYPSGYAYRRWTVGQALPALLFSSAYYFTNYAVLGLDPPPYGYQWVRYGPDVLLVNIRTGEVLDVNHDVFY